MIIYDITDRDSFENVKNWITEIEKYKLRIKIRYASAEV